MLNFIRTVINPQVPSETPPKSTDRSLSEYLSRMFKYSSNALRNIYDWQKKHLDPLLDPHPQYMQTVYSGIYFQDLDRPLDLLVNNKVMNYTGYLVDSSELIADLNSGTIIIPYEQQGIYLLQLSGFAKSWFNAKHILTMYFDGKPTLLKCPIVVRANQEFTSFSGSMISNVPAGEIDCRLEFSSAGSLSLFDLKINIIKLVAPARGNPLILPGPVPPMWNP